MAFRPSTFPIGDPTKLANPEISGVSNVLVGAGVAGLVWRGNYDPQVTYLVNDAVYYQGSSYVLTEAFHDNGKDPVSYPANWNLVAQKGSTGPQGPAYTPDWSTIANKPTFSTVATTGSYNDLSNKPTLFSGSYNDLTNKPTLFSGSYSDLTGKPTFSTVATTGSYNDLSNKPTKSTFGLGNVDNTSDFEKPVSSATQTALNAKASIIHSHPWGDITGKPTFSTVATSGNYADLSNKPDLTLKADLVSGLVPAYQLPSYVDDVLEYASLSAFPTTGEGGKIYVAKDTNYTYRWSGSTYIQIGGGGGGGGAVSSVNGQTGTVVIDSVNSLYVDAGSGFSTSLSFQLPADLTVERPSLVLDEVSPDPSYYYGVDLVLAKGDVVADNFRGDGGALTNVTAVGLNAVHPSNPSFVFTDTPVPAWVASNNIQAPGYFNYDGSGAIYFDSEGPAWQITGGDLSLGTYAVFANTFFGDGSNLSNIPTSVNGQTGAVTINSVEGIAKLQTITYDGGSDTYGAGISITSGNSNAWSISAFGLANDADFYVPNGSIYAAYSISAQQNISAFSFYGDGSNLTGYAGGLSVSSADSADVSASLSYNPGGGDPGTTVLPIGGVDGADLCVWRSTGFDAPAIYIGPRARLMATSTGFVIQTSAAGDAYPSNSGWTTQVSFPS